MVCINSCLIGSALIGGMILTMLTTSTSNVFKNFENLLNNEQKKIYLEITKERAQIYLIGFFIGILFGYLFIANSNYDRKSKVCLFITVAIVVNLSYYKIMPKSKYMLEYLSSTEQNKAWLEIYKHMQRRYMTGILLGILGYLFIGNGIC